MDKKQITKGVGKRFLKPYRNGTTVSPSQEGNSNQYFNYAAELGKNLLDAYGGIMPLSGVGLISNLFPMNTAAGMVVRDLRNASLNRLAGRTV